MFDQPSWQPLKLKRVRYIVPWDYAKDAVQHAEVDGLHERRARRQAGRAREFTARRGCYVNGKYSKSKACKAPSVSAYKKAVKAFRRQFPWVKTFAPWNEVNHVSQPTYKSPKLARRVLRRRMKQRAARSARHGRRRARPEQRRRATCAGSSGYSKNKAPDLGPAQLQGRQPPPVQGPRRRVLQTSPGQVWLTETGGIVHVQALGLQDSPSRAASATKYMFQLADRFDSKKRATSRRSRGSTSTAGSASRTARFDAGLVNPDGYAAPGARRSSRSSQAPA